MRFSLVFIILLWSLVFLGCDDHDQKGSITGTVLNAFDHTALSDVFISTDPQTESVASDSFGNYLISDVDDGTYLVTASKIGFDTALLPDVRVVGGAVVRANVLMSRQPSVVILFAVEKSHNSNVLTWSVADELDFVSYRVYRSTAPSDPGTQIGGIIPERSVTQYTDDEVTLGTTYFYSVAVENVDGELSFSNVASVEAGIGVELEYDVSQLGFDGTRNCLYGLSRSNNQLLFLNSETIELEKSIFVGVEPTDFDVGPSGDTLFVISFGTNRVAVVDLDSREVIRWISFPTHDVYVRADHFNISAGRPGRLYYTGGEWFPRLHVLDSYIGEELGSFVFDPYSGVGDVATGGNGDYLFIWEQDHWSTLNPKRRFKKIDCTTDNLFETQASGEIIEHRPIDGRIILFESSELVFCKHYGFPVSNIATLTIAFPEPIYEISTDLRFAFSEWSVFDVSNGLRVRRSPVTSTVVCSSADGHWLYTFDSVSSRLFVYDLLQL